LFNQIFCSAFTQRRHERSPLFQQRVRFLKHCADRGSSRETLQEIAAYQLAIIDRLRLLPAGRVEPGEIESAALRWTTRKYSHPRLTDRSRGRARFISVATRWLEFIGRLTKTDELTKPYASVLDQWVEHMRSEKGLAPLTIATESWHVKHFLRHLEARGLPLQQISIGDIDDAIAQRAGKRGYARRTTRLHVSALRAFLRFTESRHLCRKGFTEAMGAPTVYRQEFLPSGPSWEEVRRLITSAKGKNPKDIRDCAILTILSIYGLRAGEVVRLRWQDFNWNNSTLLVQHGKRKGDRIWPLPESVRRVVTRYVQEVRPVSSHSELFLTLRRPFRPMSLDCLSRMVRYRMRRLNIQVRRSGPHSIRHACATRLLAYGLSMKEIGDYLGHRDPEATRIYAKVDLTALRQVADFDLGGLA
jgi:site-specific recombinase XerD